MQYNRDGLPEHEEQRTEPIPFVKYTSIVLIVTVVCLWLLI